jgi:amino acid adenylation domain-containing protein
MHNLAEGVAESSTEGALLSARRKVVPGNPFVPFERREIEQSISQRFEKQVSKHRERIAVKSRSCQLTYDELNRAANRVARAILALRGEGEEQIALLFEHGAGTVISLMGVMKAGRCYVPVDPLYPRERIQYILEDSHPSVIVTNNRNRTLAGEMAGAEAAIINIDEMDAGISDANLDLFISPDSRHAIYYTSGSSGRPKGVIRVHRNTLHGIMNQTNAYHICPEDRMCLTASQSFGASATDTFGALLNGACLLPFDLNAESLGNLAKWLSGEEITIFHPVPTLFRNFVACLPKDQGFPKLRLILFGGEAVCKRDVQLYKEHFSDCCLLRCGYSVTEANGGPTLMLIDKQTEIAGNIVPAGYVMSDKEIWILDENRNRLGCNQAGEIAVRSRYLSPGYWRRPELTRAFFLPDPEGGDTRIYLTGDLGRLSADGCLEHLGRKDMQVKVRGVRIELAEVEAALQDIPEVKEAAVVAREDPRGDKRLVAYVVAAQGEGLPSVARLRAALMKSVPAQMVPSAFVSLDSLPTTPNGKVDRLALPDPPTARPLLDSAFIAPRNAVEEWLTRLWENVLGVAPIGVQDNFFELGGHSFSAARLFAEIEEVLGKTLPLPLLLQAPTIEQLAAVLKQDGQQEQGAFLIRIQTQGSRPPLFCVNMPNGGIFVHLSRHLGPDQPCYGLHSFARSGRTATIESLAADYVRRMRVIQPYGPYYLCGLCSGGMAAYEMAQQLLAADQRVAWLALFDTFIPRRGVLPLVLQRMIRRWAGHGERRAQRRADRSRIPAPASRQLLRLRRYEHENRKALSRAMALYRPKPYPGRLHLFLAEQSRINEARGSRLAWRDLAQGGAETLSVPGTHHDMLLEPHVTVLARHVRRCLEEAQHKGS